MTIPPMYIARRFSHTNEAVFGWDWGGFDGIGLSHNVMKWGLGSDTIVNRNPWYLLYQPYAPFFGDG